MTNERAARLLHGAMVSNAVNGRMVMPADIRDELDAAGMLKRTDTGLELDVDKLRRLAESLPLIMPRKRAE